jgi:hypothetical protein
MANGFMDAARRARDAAIATRSRRRQPIAEDEVETDEAPADAELLERVRALEAENEKGKQLIAELVETAEQLQARIVELIAGAEPMAKVLRLPGVKTFLLQRFHPDKWPDANEQQKQMLTEAIQVITATYAALGKE